MSDAYDKRREIENLVDELANQADILECIERFAEKFKNDENAGRVLISFLNGECLHIYSNIGKCHLCYAEKD